MHRNRRKTSGDPGFNSDIYATAGLSYNFLERKVLERGHWLDSPRNDYGIDATMFHHSERGEVENGEVRFSTQGNEQSNSITRWNMDFPTPSESVTPADLMSTEIHLHVRGIADEALESLLRGMSAIK